MTFEFISIENSGKLKSKNTLRVEINQFCVGLRDTVRNSYTFDKIYWVIYATHFFKSRGSVIRNLFLEYRTKHVNIFARRNVIFTLFATNEAKNILYRHISSFCSDPIYSKSIKKNHKSPIF